MASGAYQQVYWILAGIAVPIALYMGLQPRNPEHPHKQTLDVSSSHHNIARSLPMIVAGMLFRFFYVRAELTFGNWIFTYTVTLKLADATQAAYLTSGFWLAFTIGRLVSIPAAARFKSAQIQLHMYQLQLRHQPLMQLLSL